MYIDTNYLLLLLLTLLYFGDKTTN